MVIHLDGCLHIFFFFFSLDGRICVWSLTSTVVYYFFLGEWIRVWSFISRLSITNNSNIIIIIFERMNSCLVIDHDGCLSPAFFFSGWTWSGYRPRRLPSFLPPRVDLCLVTDLDGCLFFFFLDGSGYLPFFPGWTRVWSSTSTVTFSPPFISG